jgi:hypothetical protein
LDASVAAHERGCHLDPRVVDSVAHTFFLLGDNQRTLDCYGTKGGYYLDCAALVALGDNEKALAKLRQREQAGGATGTVRAIMRSLKAYLEGDREECIRATQIDETHARKTPESLFYLARQLARVNESERAISILFDVIDSGFLCSFALARDPWLDSLRSSHRFSELLQVAEVRRSHAHAAFLAAGGQELLGISGK